MAAPKYLDPKKPKSGSQKELLRFADIVWRMIATITLGTFIGVKLDQFVIKNETPWATVILGLLSVGAALYLVVVSVSKKEK